MPIVVKMGSLLYQLDVYEYNLNFIILSYQVTKPTQKVRPPCPVP